jgi:hypothetical protein
MERRRGLGIFSILVGLVFFVAMAFGLGRAVRGEDVTAFFFTPFLLTAALVCLGVGFHQLWGHRPPPETPPDRTDGPSANGGPSSP